MYLWIILCTKLTEIPKCIAKCCIVGYLLSHIKVNSTCCIENLHFKVVVLVIITKPLVHGLQVLSRSPWHIASWSVTCSQPIKMHLYRSIKDFHWINEVTGHKAMCQGLRETACYWRPTFFML